MNREEKAERIFAQAERMSANEERPRDGCHPLAQFVDLDLDHVEAPSFVLDNLIQEGVVLLAGAPGVGKTTSVIPLMCRAAWLCQPNDPLRPTQRRKVLWITEDLPQAKRVLYAYRMYGGSGCSNDEFREWFKLVEARRGRADEFVLAKRELLQSSNPMLRLDGSTLMVPPVAVLDTKSAVLNLENENDNAETSKVIATLKQGYALPVLMLGHTPKALSKSEAKDLSSRGAGANEGDTHQTLYFVADEATQMRYLYLGKRRFETDTVEIEFQSETHYVEAMTPLGHPVQMGVRMSTPRLLQANVRAAERAQAKAEQEEAETIEQNRRIRGELLDAAAAAVLAGNPLSSRQLRDKVSGKTETVSRHLETLKEECWLIEVRIPDDMVPTNNARRDFVVALDEGERRQFLETGVRPAEKARIPPSWAKPRPPKASKKAVSLVPTGTNGTTT